MLTLLALAAATLASEDVAAVLTGILIAEGAVSLLPGVMACALGIYAGDLLLFAAGRTLGARALGWSRVSRVLTPARVADLEEAWRQNAGSLVLSSRFVPGTRLALYVAAGALGCSARAFAWWSAVAVALWTPLIVLASANLLPPSYLLDAWPARIAGAVLLVVVCRALRHVLEGRYLPARIAATVSRVWRWEFWPAWLFYAPVAIWIGLLAIRYRGIGVLAAANPGMPDGGIVGESKHAILRQLPSEWTIPSVLIEPGPVDTRVFCFAELLTHRGWSFPLVIKPDVGQRGTGVKLIRTMEDVRRYLDREAGAVLVQPYHPGPYEAGVFYYRMPSWRSGRILSVTDKQFPAIVGDGNATLRDLVWADRRLRMQAGTFLSRHSAVLRRVPVKGERVALGIAGNHCQGTLFRDGRHLITPQLEERIDAIARHYRGFFVGRFDIRYADSEQFKAGEGLAIVELNGATAESTNIYDPAGSLLAAYRQLFAQWALIFAIGAANRVSGAPGISLGRLWELVREHFARGAVFETSD
jgi:membrane protein DedA with SNARE-associated domain